MPLTRMLAPQAAVVAAVLGAAVLGPAASPAQAAPYDKRWESMGAGVHRASPTLGELSVGRVVLSADMQGWLRALRSDGSVAWRVPVDPRAGIRSAVESSPAVGDLDGVAGNEVVVGAGSIHPPFARQDGGVVSFRGDGSVRWRWIAPDRRTPGGAPDGYGDAIVSSPAIGDVDGDGINDVVFGGLDQQIWALRGTDGAVVPGFPFEQTDTVFSSPALYDVDGDGSYEIFIGGDASHNPAVPGTYNGGVLRALKAGGGRVVQLWRFNTPDIVASSPAIGDINGDGRKEVVFGSGGFWNPPDNRRMWAVHLDNGSLVPGWPQGTDGMVFGSPALGDVIPGDGGRQEVVVGDVLGRLYAWRGNGALAWKSDPGQDNDTFYSGPSIADLDGDGDQDVAIGYGFAGALLVRGTDGALMRRVVGGPFASEVTPLIADFPGVGRRLFVAGWDPRIADFASGALTAFELAPTTAPAAWPTFRGDPRHLGGPESVQWVRGYIGLRYNALGGAGGFLGAALTPERATPTRPGRYNHFQGGSIYWSADTGAWEVHGQIRDRWASMGWENSPLGFPLSNENPIAGGAFSIFQGGNVYWSPSTGAREVRGSIFLAYGRARWENGRLGYPTTGELRTPTKPGAFNHFTGGSIYWSPTTNAHPLIGAVRDAFAASGWENGCLGFPVSDERESTVGGVLTRVVDFQNGSITWTAAGGAKVACR